MKVTKHYEQNHVILYVEEGDLKTCITLDSDRQERRNMLGAAMMGMLAQMAHRDRDDEDDE